MRKMEYKGADGGGVAHLLDEAKGSGFLIAGYASRFGQVDHSGDRTMRGCFASSLKKRPQIPVLWLMLAGSPTHPKCHLR